MSEVIGIVLIFSAIIIFITFMLGWDITIGEKIWIVVLSEIFICLLAVGCYLVAK